MGRSRETHRARRPWAGVVLACLIAVGGGLTAAPAWAHGSGETAEGYVLVQQALGHLAHDTSANGIESAMEKINDALATKDQVGVDVAQVNQAKAALDAGNVHAGQALLQNSITDALSTLPPATGEQTGTKVLLSAQEGRGGITMAVWLTLLASSLMLVLGLVAGWRYRPKDRVRDLRGILRPAATGTPVVLPRV